MRHDQYQPVKESTNPVMDKFRTLPSDLQQDIIVKAENFKNRANAQKPEGEKVGMRLRDAVEVIMTLMFFEPAWTTKERG